MNKIANHANASVGTIYHYFPSKEVLILELWYYCNYQIKQQLTTVSICGKFKDIFFELFTILIDYNINNKLIYQYLRQFKAAPFCNTNFLTNTEITSEDPIGNLFERGMVQKEIQSMTYHSFLYFVTGCIFQFLKMSIDGHFELTKKNKQDIIQILWDGASSPNLNIF